MTKEYANPIAKLLGLSEQSSPSLPVPNASAAAGSTSYRGIGLGQSDNTSAPSQEQTPRPQFDLPAVMLQLMSDKAVLERILIMSGPDKMMAILVDHYGTDDVRAAWKRTRKPRLTAGHFIIRRALSLLCESFGYTSDSAAAMQLAPFFTSNRIENYGERRHGSIRKALAEARKCCSNDPVLEQVARGRATVWREKYPAQDITHALRSMRGCWKKRTPF